jgi:hypothetical protein
VPRNRLLSTNFKDSFQNGWISEGWVDKQHLFSLEEKNLHESIDFRADSGLNVGNKNLATGG